MVLHCCLLCRSADVVFLDAVVAPEKSTPSRDAAVDVKKTNPSSNVRFKVPDPPAAAPAGDKVPALKVPGVPTPATAAKPSLRAAKATRASETRTTVGECAASSPQDGFGRFRNGVCCSKNSYFFFLN